MKGSFNILNDIIKHFTLVQLINYIGNANHAISVFGYWIFDSNYGKTLLLNRESLDMVFDPSVGKEQVVTFEIVFNAVIYIHKLAQPKK